MDRLRRQPCRLRIHVDNLAGYGLSFSLLLTSAVKTSRPLLPLSFCGRIPREISSREYGTLRQERGRKIPDAPGATQGKMAREVLRISLPPWWSRGDSNPRPNSIQNMSTNNKTKIQLFSENPNTKKGPTYEQWTLTKCQVYFTFKLSHITTLAWPWRPRYRTSRKPRPKTRWRCKGDIGRGEKRPVQRWRS